MAARIISSAMVAINCTETNWVFRIFGGVDSHGQGDGGSFLKKEWLKSRKRNL
jgi:hypothetical protein